VLKQFAFRAGVWLLPISLAALAMQQSPFIFKANVGDVLVHATVLDAKDHPVAVLPESDFSLLDNGVAQKIKFFTHEDGPVSVGIVVDESGSMRPKRAEVERAALDFVRSSNPQDEVFIVNFNEDVHITSGFTSDVDKMQKALRIDVNGSTALYDAIIVSMEYMSQHAQREKQVLLVITDGDDDASGHTLEQTVKLVQSGNGPLIYALGLFTDEDMKPMRAKATEALNTLTAATGGLAYFPRDLSEVDPVAKEMAQQIREQYTFVYHATPATPGYHTIKLQVRDAKLHNLVVRARSGYIINPPAPGR
jgi:Ca-activated chloride channel homolog